MRKHPAWPLILAMALVVSACAEPPHKEMDQAQGAIDAARAAGADRYASAEYTAATDALKRSEDAATQGDYRLALNHALDSGERAREAARAAGDAKAQLRGDVERARTELAAQIAALQQRLAAAQKSRVPRAAAHKVSSAADAIEKDLQKVGEVAAAGDYLAAQALLQEIRSRLDQVAADLDAATTPQSPRRRR